MHGFLPAVLPVENKGGKDASQVDNALAMVDDFVISKTN